MATEASSISHRPIEIAASTGDVFSDEFASDRERLDMLDAQFFNERYGNWEVIVDDTDVAVSSIAHTQETSSSGASTLDDPTSVQNSMNGVRENIGTVPNIQSHTTNLNIISLFTCGGQCGDRNCQRAYKSKASLTRHCKGLKECICGFRVTPQNFTRHKRTCHKS